MQASFDAFWPKLLGYEGGLSLDRNDPGNWTGGKIGKGVLAGTKYGIAAASFPTLDIKNLTEAQAKTIYVGRYAAPIRFNDLPAGTDVATLDPTINNGVKRGAEFLQEALGVPEDGDVGPLTIDAARKADAVATVKTICAKRLAFDEGLTSLFRRYGKGWTARIASVEAFAVTLALKAQNLSPAQVSTELQSQGKTAQAQSTQAKTGAGTAGAGGTGVTVTQHHSLPLWALIAIGLAFLVTLIWLAWRAHVHAQRAEAYAKASAEAAEAPSAPPAPSTPPDPPPAASAAPTEGKSP